MAHRLYRRAAMTAVSFTVLVAAGIAEAQTKRYADCRWEPNRPLAQHRYGGHRDCVTVRRGADVRATGAVTRAQPRRAATNPAKSSGTVVPRPAGRTMQAQSLAQGPAIHRRDCRYHPHYPVAAPYWIDENGCLRMRSGNDDVFVTGSITGVPPGGPVGGPVGRVGNGTGNNPIGGVGVPPAGGVSPVIDGPRGPVGDVPNGGGPRGSNPRADNPRADNPRADDPGMDDPTGDMPGGRNPTDRDFTGNPGNGNMVGRAGENPNGRDFGDGTRGRSDVQGHGGGRGNNGQNDRDQQANNGFGNGGRDGSNAGKQDVTR